MEESFDLVLSRMTLHWIEDLAPVFERLCRALRRRGRLVFSVEHPVLTSRDVSREDGQGRGSWLVDDYFVPGPRVAHWFGAPERAGAAPADLQKALTGARPWSGAPPPMVSISR